MLDHRRSNYLHYLRVLSSFNQPSGGYLTPQDAYNEHPHFLLGHNYDYHIAIPLSRHAHIGELAM